MYDILASALLIALGLGLGVAMLIVVFRLRHLRALKRGRARIEGLVPVDDVEIYVQDQGRGYPLILLHGIGASSYTWRFVVEKLKKTFRVITVDLPGFGASTKDVALPYDLDSQAHRILTLMDRLQVPQAFLMGSSMGGALALWLGKIAPERFPAIVALAPATNPKRVPIKWEWLSWTFPWAHGLYSKTILRLLYQRAVTRPDLHTPQDLLGYHLPFEDPRTVVTFLKATQLLRDPRLPHELASINSDVLILHGVKDLVVRPGDIKALTDILPTAATCYHPTGGHHLQEDDPDWTVDKVISFLDRASKLKETKT